MVTIDPTTETTRSNSSIIVRDAVFGFGSFKMRGIETVDSGGRFVEFGYFRGIEMSVAFGICWVGWVVVNECIGGDLFFFSNAFQALAHMGSSVSV